MADFYGFGPARCVVAAAMALIWTRATVPADNNDEADGRTRDAGLTLDHGSGIRIVFVPIEGPACAHGGVALEERKPDQDEAADAVRITGVIDAVGAGGLAGAQYRRADGKTRGNVRVGPASIAGGIGYRIGPPKGVLRANAGTIVPPALLLDAGRFTGAVQHAFVGCGDGGDPATGWRGSAEEVPEYSVMRIALAIVARSSRWARGRAGRGVRLAWRVGSEGVTMAGRCGADRLGVESGRWPYWLDRARYRSGQWR